jgi:hypothetical protein
MSDNLKEMIRRKELLRKGTDEAEDEADRILQDVLENGGLTTEEVYALMAH